MTTLIIRWIIREDLAQILEIENHSFSTPWDEDDFYQVMRMQNTIGKVFEYDGRILGYVVYSLRVTGILLLNIAVHEDFRRQGIGSAIMDHLKTTLHGPRRSIRLEVTERNLDAQLFWRANGFRAVNVVRGPMSYIDTEEDVYVMRYRKEAKHGQATV